GILEDRSTLCMPLRGEESGSFIRKTDTQTFLIAQRRKEEAMVFSKEKQGQHPECEGCNDNAAIGQGCKKGRVPAVCKNHVKPQTSD
ncbi:MAG: hypothetical protein PHP25_05605, partial [Candidatus Moranbacteria bacterium]|nr:hypothetical protein [Candidatus Moranbacteria bacterium]